MINLSERNSRSIALIAGGAVLAMALAPATARADDSREKEKNYKTGAAVLGAASALLILKGKNVAGALAGAGAYYAYKKGQEIKQEREQYSDYDVYSQYPGDDRYPDNSYPSNSYPEYSTYPEYDTYPDYRAPDDYRRPGDVYASYPDGYGPPAYLAPRGKTSAQDQGSNLRLK
jgi:hypothetical protein